MITTLDKERIEDVLKRYHLSGKLPDLEEKLLSLTPVLPEQVPPEVITMNSIVSVYDSTAESSLKVRLVYQLDVIKGHQASILSPLGTALLGSRAGEEVKFKVREGGTKLIKIETIIFQPEANGEYDI
jgi:regulator of nucleoside diphosphate kinase